jgi:nitrogen fixation NifU-like protein
MSELRDLYQEVILDHTRRPRNFGPLESANHHARGHNPLCGDELTVFLRMSGDRIEDVHFVGSGCAISTASASLMTEAVKGKSAAEAEKLYQAFHEIVTSAHDADVPVERLGKLAALAGVREFPLRVKCASLAWHTLQAALADAAEPVSTE